MKVRVIGNSCTWFSRPNSNYIINDEIIVDTPQSSTKFMLKYIDYEKIKYIFITHFHSDHFMDLHLIYDYIKHRANRERVVVIGPKTLLKRLIKLYRIIEQPYINKKAILKQFDIRVIKPEQEMCFDGFKVKAVAVEHKVSISLGYIFKFDDTDKRVAFTGDTIMCDGLTEIIENSDVIFMDTASHVPSSTHMSVDDAIALKKKYKKKTIYNVHTTDIIYNKYAKKLNIPECNEIIEF